MTEANVMCIEAGRTAAPLTEEQLERLVACARGISLRFESPHTVNALIEAGYVERNVAGVVTITASGHAYLRSLGY